MDKILGASFLLLWFQLDCGDQQQVKQSPQSLIERSAFDYFSWYGQYPGKGLAFLIAIGSVMNKKEDGRLTGLLSMSAKQLSLPITVSQPGDAAPTSAASAQCSPGTCSLCPDLQARLQTHPAI
ncbi:hypothetical protein FD754_022954 [Muntiacus muntjak]|uniref:Uncharacterized protein n=1 Tax=Muntiacus muntjak TaxID=9888 RepID=A0A5N3UVZ4_MUNMU|nr:hypothetical protein FD754_022954 [Muntiacus muntjak]